MSRPYKYPSSLLSQILLEKFTKLERLAHDIKRCLQRKQFAPDKADYRDIEVHLCMRLFWANLKQQEKGGERNRAPALDPASIAGPTAPQRYSHAFSPHTTNASPRSRADRHGALVLGSIWSDGHFEVAALETCERISATPLQTTLSSCSGHPSEQVERDGKRYADNDVGHEGLVSISSDDFEFALCFLGHGFGRLNAGATISQ
ncbi:unnamed protein product [Phytophthora lilii]|uniref:Unnamed protein product n=1 Tax=Phytophthora lilii TaxID=2077276 RepID=A0A9W6TCG5_9STRA|nr:unnamed protein product [Phytophthora lilii]